MESICYLLIDEKNKENSIYTGDTLFIGDVGRPDLASESIKSTEEMAGLLFDSLYVLFSSIPFNKSIISCSL